MRFYSEAARLKHPQARLIPNSLWDQMSRKWSGSRCECSQFDDEKLNLITMDLSAIDVDKVSTRSWEDKHQLNCWLCILLGHTDASMADLLQAAGRFSLPSSIILEGALLTNRLDIAERIKTNGLDIQKEIVSHGYRDFRLAAANGHLDVLNWLKTVAPGKLQDLIAGYDYWPFHEAAINGHLDVLNWLKTEAPGKLQDMIESKFSDTSSLAAGNGHLEILKWLKTEAPSKWHTMIWLSMITTQYYRAFCLAAGNGHLNILNWFKTDAPGNKLQDAISALDYGAFRIAAINGHFDVLNWLKTEAPGKWLDMIEANYYNVFCEVTANGHLDVLIWLKTEDPVKWQAMIEAHYYDAFCSAAANGHLDVLNWLKTEAPSKFQAMDDYKGFRTAALNGHLDVLNWLKTEAPGKLQAMIDAYEYGAFREAAEHGHLDILNWLKTEAPDKLQAMITARNYGPFRIAATNGQLDVLNWLKSEAPDKWQAMTQANPTEVFGSAVSNGRLDILIWLKTELSELSSILLPILISDEHYAAFRIAASSGPIAVLNWFKEQVPDRLQAMIEAEDFGAFRGASIQNKHYMLTYPICFAYAEKHEAEYSHLTYPFIAEKLATLHSQYSRVQIDNPHAVFDIADVNDAQLCFYIIRNLIRRNDPALLDDIRFLLEIPAVKALAHQQIYRNRGVPNELVRLALGIGNRAAAAILLAIPAVHDLARANNFYTVEARGEFNLRELAHDRESSLTSLTTDEQRRLDAAIKKYKPLLSAAGPGELMKALREQLEERYAEHPATIPVNGTSVVLPVDWASFQRLELDATQRQEAFKAYYQNKNHTALRYLSYPNHWMAPNASYVYINDARTERWSTFEEYQPLITLFWLAAIDKTTPAIDCYTVETRLDHFIEELALIGRAHNWDKSRPIAGSESQTEEYDDLAGDKPTCFSGVKRRLFQSVLGHPLFKMLTQEMIDDELRNFVRDELSKAITETNRGQLKVYFDTYVGTLEISAEGVAAFTALNIPTAKQNAFIAALSEKYGTQFDAKMQLNLRKELSLNPESDNPTEVLHAFKFDEFAGTAQLLAPIVATESSLIYPPKFLGGSTCPSATPAEPSATHSLQYHSSR